MHTMITFNEKEMNSLAAGAQIRIPGLRREGDTEDACLRANIGCRGDTREQKQALDLILTERAKQRRNWGDDHDDNKHTCGELALAAACYACASVDDHHPIEFCNVSQKLGAVWPWPNDKMNSSGRDTMGLLQAAGALILAEMERILREENNTQ